MMQILERLYPSDDAPAAYIIIIIYFIDKTAFSERESDVTKVLVQ